jgi:hypothetical protein
VEGVFVELNAIADLPKWDEGLAMAEVKSKFDRLQVGGTNILEYFCKLAKDESDQLRRETDNKVWKGCATYFSAKCQRMIVEASVSVLCRLHVLVCELSFQNGYECQMILCASLMFLFVVLYLVSVNSLDIVCNFR